MLAWRIELECPACPPGTPLAHVNQSVTDSHLNLHAAAVAQCGECRVEWLVEARLSDLGKPSTQFNRGKQRIDHRPPVTLGTR